LITRQPGYALQLFNAVAGQVFSVVDHFVYCSGGFDGLEAAKIMGVMFLT
jgi:hypothetical protein